MENFNIFIPVTSGGYDRAIALAHECGAFVISQANLPVTSAGNGSSVGLIVGISQVSQTVTTAMNGGISFATYLTSVDSIISPTTLGVKVEAFLPENVSWLDDGQSYDSTLASLEIVLSSRADMINLIRTRMLSSDLPINFYFFSESFASSLPSFDQENIARYTQKYLEKCLGDGYDVRLIE